MLISFVTTKNKELTDAFVKIKRPKSFAAVVDAYQYRFFTNVSELRNNAESVALAMLKQRRLPSLALRLALLLLQPPLILTIIENIDKTGLLHPGVVESNLKSWNRAVESYSQQDIAALETKLRLSQSAGVRRLGLALLVEATGRYGWNGEYCGHLCEYCNDSDLWVSEAAGLIEPPLA